MRKAFLLRRMRRSLINSPAQAFAPHAFSWYRLATMTADRIASALARIESAMARIDASREAGLGADGKAGGGSAKVVELVNVHEKLREQVAESLRELDDLLTQLED